MRFGSISDFRSAWHMVEEMLAARGIDVSHKKRSPLGGEIRPGIFQSHSSARTSSRRQVAHG